MNYVLKKQDNIKIGDKVFIPKNSIVLETINYSAGIVKTRYSILYLEPKE